MTSTLAGGTPGTPPSSVPRPPCGFSSAQEPICVARRPATSLIGASSGLPVFGLHGLVGDGRDPGVDERTRERLVRREVEVREEDEIGSQPWVLLRDRLFHLEQELGLRPGAVDGGDPGADGLVGVVRERAAEPAPLSTRTSWPRRTTRARPRASGRRDARRT